MVPRCIADIFEVIMLPTCAHTFLAGYRAFVRPYVLAEKDRLKLDHPRIGKKKRWIISRDKRGTFDNLMPLGPEKIYERVSNIVACHIREYHIVFSEAESGPGATGTASAI